MIIICILLPLLVGFLSAYITKDSYGQYSRISKPFLSPPAWLFPIVWTVLYILMGVGSYYILQSDAPEAMLVLVLYLLQLFLNVIWSPIFFNRKDYKTALLVLILLWLVVLTMVIVIAMTGISLVVLVCFLPYLLWCTFALYLNWQVARSIKAP